MFFTENLTNCLTPCVSVMHMAILVNFTEPKSLFFSLDDLIHLKPRHW